MQIHWPSGKLDGPQVDCEVPGAGHPQALDPARASTKARAARCELYRKEANLGLKPHEWTSPRRNTRKSMPGN
eukprot:1157751-Pelagomonas_calceolata.AAC.6